MNTPAKTIGEPIILNIKVIVSFCIFIFINALFSIKYIGRYTDIYILPTLVITAALCFIFYFYKYYTPFVAKYYRFLISLYFILYIIVCTLIFRSVLVDSLNVDRWSVITSFWNNFENGEYVYFAKSNVGNPPGPMPFYFILAYPFYLLGELGWYSALGLPIFILLLRYSKNDHSIIIMCLRLLSFSLFIWYEILCRSNIFLNGTLVLFSIVFFLNTPKMTLKHLVISSILFGLFLSVRSVYSIAYIIVCIFAIKANYINIKQFLILCCISLLSFVITFLPFIINFKEDFFSSNPFIVQSTFLMPFLFTCIFIILAFVFGFICKNKSDVFFYISLDLFLCILTYFIIQISEIGVREAVFGWTADISYFIFSIPFALYYICFRLQNSTKNDTREKSNSCITGL